MTWVVYRTASSYSRLASDYAEIRKRTPKQLQLGGGTGYSSRISPDDALAEFATEAEARNLNDDLRAIKAEYDHAIAVAMTLAMSKRLDAIAAAQAIEAQRAETVQQGSVADESAVGDSRCAQTAPKGAI